MQGECEVNFSAANGKPSNKNNPRFPPSPVKGGARYQTSVSFLIKGLFFSTDETPNITEFQLCAGKPAISATT